MQAKSVIDKFDTIYRNNVPYSVKIDWLKALDHRVFIEIISTHEGGPEEYVELDDEGDNHLIIEPPYDDIYICHLRCKLDELTNETARYINSSQAFNDKLASYAAYYNRTHMPKERAFLKFY